MNPLIRQIICSDEATESLVKEAKAIGEQMARDRVSTSQVRNIYGAVKQLQLLWHSADAPGSTKAFRQVMLLRPKIAYQAKRSPNLTQLKSVLDDAIEEIGTTENKSERYARFWRFAEFFEAILAYHTAAGGKS